MALIACLYSGFTLPFITLFKINDSQSTLCSPGHDFSPHAAVLELLFLRLDFCCLLLGLLCRAASRPNSCSQRKDYMKSPPRHKLNPIRGLWGTCDDFPPATANRKTVRPLGRPLITLMYATLTPASSAKDRKPPAERRDFVHMLTSINPASLFPANARGTPPSLHDSSFREREKKTQPSLTC